MLIVSIDIGEKNLGWTLVRVDSFPFKLQEAEIRSGVYDYKLKHTNVVIARVSSLHQFFNELIDDDVKLAIVERQVNLNNVAMQLMYAVVAILYKHTSNIEIYDPKMKFTHIGQTYDTRNKHHKKQSIANMRCVLSHIDKPELLATLESASKKDDIADSFNQMVVFCAEAKLLDVDDVRDLYRE